MNSHNSYANLKEQAICTFVLDDAPMRRDDQ